MKKIKFSPIVNELMLASNKEYVQGMLDEINEKREKVTDDQRKAALIAASKNPIKAAEIAAARVEVINAYLWAENLALADFEYVPIADDEWPQLVNEDDQSFNILKTVEHGEAPEQTFVRANTTSMLTPYQLSSGVIKYAILSGITGRINDSEKVNQKVGRSFEQLLNTDIYALQDAALGTFPAGSIIADSRIVSGTLPTTNVINASGEGSFTFAAYKQIASHFLRLGKALSYIKMNPVDVSGLWDWQHLVSTTASGSQDGSTMITTRIKDDILRSGGLKGELLGQTFKIFLDQTLPLKYARFYATDACGTLYDKPGISDVMRFDKKWMKGAGYGNNWEGVEMNRWLVPTIKDPQRLNFGRIQFDT